MEKLPLLPSSWLFWLLNHKGPVDVKPEMYITFAPTAGGFGNEIFFDHPGRVAEEKLENMSAGFNIQTQGQ